MCSWHSLPIYRYTELLALSAWSLIPMNFSRQLLHKELRAPRVCVFRVAKQLHPGWVASRQARPELGTMWRPEDFTPEVSEAGTGAGSVDVPMQGSALRMCTEHEASYNWRATWVCYVQQARWNWGVWYY